MILLCLFQESKNIIFTCGDSKNNSWHSPLVIFSVPTQCFYPREQSSAGIHLALLLLLFLLLLLHVCTLLVLYSMKQFDNLRLQQGSHARMQFGILPLQQGNSRRRRVYAVWYPATASDCRALVLQRREIIRP
jgi:hypothetical protein